MAIRDVLVFTPVLRLEPETVQAIFALEWEGAISYLFQRDNPLAAPEGAGEAFVRATGVGNHLHQYRRGRQAFLQGSYDAMLVVESDIVPPPFALRRLAALEVDVAYGVYVFRRNNVINVFERYADNNGQPARNIGESLSLHPRKLQAALRAGKVRCSGAGLGCTLIRRHVLERFDFRTLTQELHPQVHCDTWFTHDVHGAGFEQMADMTVVCGHKREDGEILWPSWK